MVQKTKHLNITIVFISLLPFIMVMGNSLFIPLIPYIQATFNLTTVESGWVLTSFSIPAALFVLVGGIISDRFGRKKIAIYGLSLIAIGCAISAVSLFPIEHVWYYLIVGRVIQGIGAGIVSPLAMAFIADLFEGQKRIKALGMIEVFNGAGKMVSPVIGGFILYLSWNMSFVFYLFVTLIALAGIFICVEKDIKVSRSYSLKDTGVTIVKIGKENWRWLLPITYGGGIGMFLLFGFLFYLSYVAGQQSPFPNEWNGVIVAMPLIALVSCSYLLGRHLKNSIDAYKRMMLISVIIMIAGTLGLLWQHSFLFIVIMMFVYSAGLGCFLPAANAALSAVVSNELRGTVFAFYSMIRFLGVAFGPIVFGIWMADLQQLVFSSFFFISVLALFMALSWTCFPLGHDCSDENLSHI